jgi:hypothetical protein
MTNTLTKFETVTDKRKEAKEDQLEIGADESSSDVTSTVATLSNAFGLYMINPTGGNLG